MRVYDPRAGRFLSVDPLTGKYPHYTPYSFSGNKPIWYIDLDGLEERLPWYLRRNQYGEKPVLTLGLGDLPTANKWDYGNYSWYSDQSIMTFFHNSVASGWNGIANTWNEAMNGKTFSDMTAEGILNLQETRLSDFKKVETWENIFGGILAAYAIKRVGNAYGSAVRTAEAALVKNRTSFVKNFYEHAGYAPEKTLMHIEGIDFSKPVFEKTYKKGTILDQWRKIDPKTGESIPGDYYTLPGTDPNKLGIYLGNRIKIQVVLQEDTKFLQTTTSDITDTWSVGGKSIDVKGGGTQLFQAGVKATVKE
jgi:hypothetical protein